MKRIWSPLADRGVPTVGGRASCPVAGLEASAFTHITRGGGRSAGLLLAALSWLLAATLPVSAQQSLPVANYVSQLRAIVDGPTVRLLWKDSDLPNATYIVYRSSQEIDASTFPSAVKLAAVPAGTQAYVDTPPDRGSYFYAVLTQDSSGKRYDLFIPFRDTTVSAVAVTAPRPAPVQYAQVTDLVAKQSDGSIVLTFHASLPGRQLVVYRDTSPITNVNDLLGSLGVGLIASSQDRFTDEAIAGIPYYYAIIDSKMLATGAVKLVPGSNVTTSPAEIPLQATAIGKSEFSKQPLRPVPFLVATPNGIGGPLLSTAGAVSPRVVPLSQAAQRAVQSLLDALPAEKPQPLEPVLLDPDKALSPQASGDEHALSVLLSSSFEAKEWPKARAGLEAYLAIPRSRGVEQRARFYLGQCYYFEGRYRHAFLEFLLVEDSLYSAVQPWLSSIFEKLHQEDQITGAKTRG